ncbi:SMODS domain-containing nucleotidyltransferase [Pelagerythrobacter rhizovicinus]|uniref:Nucleotidyltransferase n=1 Tax=Pelagerythrobacter rhizovicinus TaxID=2268576 RepID=A0A4Q2KGN4_9SPHN|nr:nucleotidyltransferase [Pelagerythrobacter rhizovicinus]RXZ64244.1 nucleotidyltransferase [Pelagerythrobacter rhizovicinus]
MNNALMALAPTPSTWLQWRYVEQRFRGFIENLAVTDAQLQDGLRKQAGVRATLNRWYYGHNDEAANSLLTGSWGKYLRVRPPRDVDVMFALPWEVYRRFEARAGNRQSQLLQEVRSVLAQTYPQSEMRGDGQVVVVRFATMPVEIIPAFALDNGQYLICDTNDGGSYRLTDPIAEIASLDQSDEATAGATRRLIRMAKQWQRHCSVPIKSFMLERMAVEFLRTWPYSHDYYYHDWMVRDFFAFLVENAGRSAVMPGTGLWVTSGVAWASKARAALTSARRACEWEQASLDFLAAGEWKSLFGSAIGSTL